MSSSSSSSSHSSSLPPNFDPFKTHPFTNIKRAPQQMASLQPSHHVVPTYQTYTHGAPPPSSSLPTSQTPTPTGTPIQAPQPNRISPIVQNTVRTHVFEPFTLERASPDLLDVLAKKGSSRPRGRNDAKALQKQSSK